MPSTEQRSREFRFRSCAGTVLVAAALLPAYSPLALAQVVADSPVEATTQAGEANGDTAQPLTTLTLKTRVVAVSAVVRSKSGQPEPGLTRDDFVLKQDGAEQRIRYFSQGSELPLTIALMVDTSSSQHAFIGDETLAADVFFETMLGRSRQNALDRAELVQFDDNILPLSRLTGSASALHLAMMRLELPHPAMPGGGGTLLYDAIARTAAESLSAQSGRKAMVLLTDGDDQGSRATLDQALEQAQRADVSIYAIYYSLAGFQSRTSKPRVGPGLAPLERLTSATGGRVFTVTATFGLRQIFEQISEDLRLQYELGYTLPADTKPNTLHRIELRPKEKGLTVQARSAFYAKP